MALVLADRVQETTATTGTGSITLGGAVSGFQSFAVVGNGNTCYYTITNGSAWEVGIGTYSTTGPTLARTTVLSNSVGNTSPITLSGASSVFLTYPAERSVNLDASGNVSPLGTIGSGTWNGATIPVAYGGTGVTASSGANSVVLRDANQNITFNNYVAGFTATTASAGTTVLTVASARNQVLVGSTTHTFQMPNATTLQLGQSFLFVNNSSGLLTITNNASTVIETITSGGVTQLGATNISTSAGTFGIYSFLPGSYDFNSTTATFNGAAISSAVWNGTAIAGAYGGTGLTTFVGANNALYSTGTTTLTAGTLPVAAGGTGFSGTATAGAVAYGSGTALAFNTAGTSGQVLTSAGAGTPTFSSTIDGVAIGGTTPAAGSFTTLIGGSGSANYEQITGGATTKAVQFQSLGSDANVSLAIQSKGTGAIDLATGSSGVNISNGGTVTAITRTNGGSGYTTPPTWTASAPTTAGGTTASGSSSAISLVSTPVSSGGTGYTAGDVLTFVGGTFSNAATVTVSTVSAGVITAVTITAFGAYTVAPTNPVSVTGGTGSAATFNLSFGITSSFTISVAGSGYVEQPTITFSGGGGTAAAAYATVGAEPTIRSLFGSSTAGLQLATAGGTQFQLADTTTNRWVVAKGATTGGNPSLYASTGVLTLSGAATSGVNFYSNNIVNQQMAISHTASAVNYVQVTGAATGGGVTISSQGSDAAVTLNLQAKAGGAIRFITGNGTENFRVGSVSSTVNYLQATGNIAGASPTLTAAGTDTDIDLTLTPKAAGTVRTSGTGIRLVGSTSGYVGLKGAAVAGSTTYTLPAADGTSGQVLSTDGAATLSWATAIDSTVVTLSGTQTLTNKRVNPRVSTTTSSATAVTPDISAYDQYNWTAQAATLTINAPTGTPVDGNKLIFRILDNGTARTIAFNATFTAIGVTIPTTTTASKTTYVGAVYNANNTRWDVIAVTTQA